MAKEPDPRRIKSQELPRVVARVLSGDNEAALLLKDDLVARFGSSLRRYATRHGVDGLDINGLVDKQLEKLPAFNIPDDAGRFPKVFGVWANTGLFRRTIDVVRAADAAPRSARALERRASRAKALSAYTAEVANRMINVPPEIKSLILDEILPNVTQKKREAFLLALMPVDLGDGNFRARTEEDIASELKIPLNTAKARIWRVRREIDAELDLKGWQRASLLLEEINIVGATEKTRCEKALRQGDIMGFSILDRWYTKREYLNPYLAKKR